MQTVAILGFDDSYASVIGGFADMLQVANAHMSKQGMPESGLFEWHFLSANGLPVRASNGLELTMRVLPKNRYYDLVFIPSLHYRGWQSFQRFLDSQAPVRDWLIKQWSHGAWLCANCTGTFLLADTGLLDNKVATTTWWLEGHFRERFPLVDLQMRPLVTESERLVCGGAHAHLLAASRACPQRVCRKGYRHAVRAQHADRSDPNDADASATADRRQDTQRSPGSTRPEVAAGSLGGTGTHDRSGTQAGSQRAHLDPPLQYGA